jgi:hypothetical protein
MTYEIVLKNEKLKYYKLMRDLLAALNLGGFIYLLLHTDDAFNKTFYIIFIVITSFYVLFILFERFTRQYFNDKTHRTIFFWSAIGWARSDYWWLSLVLFVFLFLDMMAHRKLLVKISEQVIELPSFPTKQVQWNELSNLVLKDGLLTIDFKNNKLIQQPIQNTDMDIDEKEFNEFCKQQLKNNELYKYN